MRIQGRDSQSAISILGQAVLKSARVIEYASDFPSKNIIPMTIYENDATTRAPARAPARARACAPARARR